jgi:glutamate/tyrosine decarboxylase-like PLP-dependent enzyme
MRRMKEDISKNFGLVDHLHNLVREHPDFLALHEPTLNGYCFRCVPNGLVERQEEPEVQALLDVLNEEIVQAVQRNGFEAVVTIRVQGRAAIRVSFCSGRTLVEEVDATFDAIARWGRLLSKKLSVRYEPDMEAKLCLSESHSSPTEVSAT